MTQISIKNDPIAFVPTAAKAQGKDSGNQKDFGGVLKEALSDINQLQIDADKAINKVTLGQSGSIHEAMIALEKADISFRTMMQVRNKILEAYQEIMRMQV
jgi:flagellar hook-basal body complex protein FliE